MGDSSNAEEVKRHCVDRVWLYLIIIVIAADSLLTLILYRTVPIPGHLLIFILPLLMLWDDKYCEPRTEVGGRLGLILFVAFFNYVVVVLTYIVDLSMLSNSSLAFVLVFCVMLLFPVLALLAERNVSSNAIGLRPGNLKHLAWLTIFAFISLGVPVVLALAFNTSTPYTYHLYSVVLLYGSLIPGIVEELVWRGYIQDRLASRFKSNFKGLVLTSLGFAFYHLPKHYVKTGDIILSVSRCIINHFPAGIVLGLLYIVSGSILAPMVAHALSNALIEVGNTPATEAIASLFPYTLIIAFIMIIVAYHLGYLDEEEEPEENGDG